MPTDSMADIDATLAAPDIIAELQAEAELCRQALLEAQAENARLERELQDERRVRQEMGRDLTTARKWLADQEAELLAAHAKARAK